MHCFESKERLPDDRIPWWFIGKTYQNNVRNRMAHRLFTFKRAELLRCLCIIYRHWNSADRWSYCSSKIQNFSFSPSTQRLICIAAGRHQPGISLLWRHNERDGVLNHQHFDCLLNTLFKCMWKKTSKLRITGLSEGNSPVTGEFSAQKASNAEKVSI